MLRTFKPKGADPFRNTPGPGQGANALLSGTQERGGSGARPVPLDEVGSRVAVPLHRPKKSREGRGVLTSASSTPPGLHDRPRYHPHSPAPKGAPEATPWGGLSRCRQVNPGSPAVERGPRGCLADQVKFLDGPELSPPEDRVGSERGRWRAAGVFRGCGRRLNCDRDRPRTLEASQV